MCADLCERLLNGEETLSVIGLGYVGLPLAMAFAKGMRVIGFDLDRTKIERYRAGIDPTREVGDDAIRATSVEFTEDPSELRRARFHIVAVPTPTHADHTPDLHPLISASRFLGENLERGSIVVFESTVYPGVTEEICVPELEKSSGLICGRDFKVAYSPERINPGDVSHSLQNVVKVVSGMDSETLETVARVYGTVVRAGIHRVPSIKTAELSKLLENTQRDVNIALMNEIVRMCDGWDIDTRAVLEAAATKWNFHPYSPGLVGGHCIGIDSWYLAFGAEQMGYHSELIPAVRSINDGMGRFVAEKTVKAILEAGKELRGARVAVLGFTFKENCPDIRNTGVIRLVEELRSYGVEVLVTDPVADPNEIRRAYGLETCDLRSIHAVDAAVLAVAHDAYRDLTVADLSSLYREGCCVLMDVKGILNPSDFVSADYLYRRL